MKKTKILSFFLAVSCLMAMLTACHTQKDTALPQLVIGCGDYEPYHYLDEDGEPAGIDVDLAREACRRMGYTPVFRQIDWDKRDALLESGEIDCLWSSFSMDGQEALYAWVGPYMRSRQVVAVMQDSPIVSLSDLEGKRIGVRAGSRGEEIFLKQADARIGAVRNVYSLNDLADLATALQSEYVDAIAGYAAAAREILQQNGIDFRFLDEELSWAYFGVAFAKNSDAALREALSAVLDEMLSDGTTAQILEKYGVDTEKTLSGLSNWQTPEGATGE